MINKKESGEYASELKKADDEILIDIYFMYS